MGLTVTTVTNAVRLFVGTSVQMPITFGSASTTEVTKVTLNVTNKDPVVLVEVLGANVAVVTKDGSEAELSVDFFVKATSDPSVTYPTAGTLVTFSGFPKISLCGTADAINETSITGKWLFISGTAPLAVDDVLACTAVLRKYKGVPLS